MKTILFFSLFMATALFADVITIDNQTNYPGKKSNTKIGVQWASSSQEMNQKTIGTMHQIDEKADFALSKEGKNQLNVPSHAKYFRVCLWTNGDSAPEYITSWVLIVEDKNYTLKQNDFYPAVLSSGSGC